MEAPILKRTILFPLAAICAALLLAGCGSSKKDTTAATPAPADTTQTTTTAPSPGGGGGSTLQLSADPSGALKFDTTSLTAKAGKVTLDMKNPSPTVHAIGVKGNGVDKDGPNANQGGDSKITVTLKPGKYTFYCPVDSHEAGGMKGALTVK
jgi:uncharacterized cupredoxin-like copper-binding protein